MRDDHLTLAESIFQAAADLSVEERDRLLLDRCGDDVELRLFVQRLLTNHDERMGSFLRPSAGERPTAPSVPTGAPQSIGPFRILKALGEGGMGTVYVAEQTAPVRRRVALKVIKAGMDSRQVIARFDVERQALALMDHPNIAKILDAGETEQGRPYFVMDLVEGEPITDYCDRHTLSTRDRLELFIPVCRAVQHAHQKGIIHRDIKPSNVLIAQSEEGPLPKVIDFGIAKATTTTLTERSFHTQQGLLIGTPAYMSPEQAEGSLDIDIRTDVYSLGTVLYELLTGEPPFDPEELQGVGLADVQRLIREVEPPKPSTRVSTTSRDSAAIAKRRRTDPGRLTRQLRGELDWIVLKSMEKDRDHRYETANSFAMDIRRYLADEAINASPPSTAYRFRKFVKRHKVGMTAASVGIVVLLGFGVSMWILRESALQARAEAQARAEELEIVTDFQASMLAELSMERMGHTLFEDLREDLRRALEAKGAPPARVESALLELDRSLAEVNATNLALGLIDEHVLQRAAETIETDFEDQPLVQSHLQESLATTYGSLGLQERALDLQSSALETRRETLGNDDPLTLESIQNLGALLWPTGRLDEAIGFLQEAVEGRQRVLGRGHRETLKSLNSLAVALSTNGQLEESLRIRQESLEIARRTLGDEDPYTLDFLTGTSHVLGSLGRHEEAYEVLEIAVNGKRRLHGDDDPSTLTTMQHMARLLTLMGRTEDALEIVTDVTDRRRRVLGSEHPRTLSSISWMGYLLRQLGRYDEAERNQREAVEGMREVLGHDHFLTLGSTTSLGEVLVVQGKYEEAIALLRPTETTLRAPHEDASLRRRLGYVLLWQGSARAGVGDFEGSKGNLIEAHGILQDYGNTHRKRALTHLVELYEAWHLEAPGEGHDRTAADWSARLAELTAAE